MKVTPLIEDASVVRKILEHLDLWQIRRGNERRTAPEKDNPAEPDWVYDPVADGWPGWSEDLPAYLPAITVHSADRRAVLRPKPHTNPSKTVVLASENLQPAFTGSQSPCYNDTSAQRGVRDPSPGLCLPKTLSSAGGQP